MRHEVAGGQNIGDDGLRLREGRGVSSTSAALALQERMRDRREVDMPVPLWYEHPSKLPVRVAFQEDVAAALTLLRQVRPAGIAIRAVVVEGPRQPDHADLRAASPLAGPVVGRAFPRGRRAEGSARISLRDDFEPPYQLDLAVFLAAWQ